MYTLCTLLSTFNSSFFKNDQPQFFLAVLYRKTGN